MDHICINRVLVILNICIFSSSSKPSWADQVEEEGDEGEKQAMELANSSIALI